MKPSIRLLAAATLLAAAALVGSVAQALPKRLDTAPALAAPARPTLRVGTLELTRCGPAYCGSIERALDPAGDVSGTIRIGFEFYPPRDPTLPLAGRLVATEGGPGYPTTGTRASYLGLFLPLMADRSLLLVDNRGTGRSAVIDCPALQQDALYRSATIAACGRQLGARADLYGTGLAADDLAAVIAALGFGPVDLYGDSYGTFFAQAFAARHPEQLRSVVLDSAYAVIGADPWYPEAAPQARSAFDQACARSPACNTQPGHSMDRIGALLEAIRAAPVAGTAPDGDGVAQPVTADARGLAYVMLSNASARVVYRDLDAAARAWAAGDTAPFLRLVAENQSAAYSANGAPRARDFSAGLFTAVSCSDYTQIYDMHLPPGPRSRAGRAAIAAKEADDPTVFAPFTIDEFLSMPQDYSVVNLCLTWPVASAAHPPGEPVAPGTPFPAVPVLVLSGDMDSLTPPAQGAQAAALFPNATQVLVANSFHVNALGDFDRCASVIVRRFVETLAPGDVSCAGRIPETRLVPAFARQVAQVAGARAGPGNEATSPELQAVAAALYTAGDALARWWVNYDGDGVGLRGGRFAYADGGGAIHFTLDRLKWTEDLEVSGSVRWNPVGGEVDALLTLGGAASGNLQAHWKDTEPLASARIRGVIGEHAVSATMYAP